MIATNLLRVSVIIILVGMIVGMAMGSMQDFRLAPAHAKWHASIAVIGAIVFPIGIAMVLLYGPQYELLTISTSVVAFLGMVLFAVVVFRFGAPQRM